MDLGMVSTTSKEQPWSKVSVSENLTWLVNQTRIFTKRVQSIHDLCKHSRELSLGLRSSKGMDIGLHSATFKG